MYKNLNQEDFMINKEKDLLSTAKIDYSLLVLKAVELTDEIYKYVFDYKFEGVMEVEEDKELCSIYIKVGLGVLNFIEMCAVSNDGSEEMISLLDKERFFLSTRKVVINQISRGKNVNVGWRYLLHDCRLSRMGNCVEFVEAFHGYMKVRVKNRDYEESCGKLYSSLITIVNTFDSDFLKTLPILSHNKQAVKFLETLTMLFVTWVYYKASDRDDRLKWIRHNSSILIEYSEKKISEKTLSIIRDRSLSIPGGFEDDKPLKFMVYCIHSHIHPTLMQKMITALLSQQYQNSKGFKGFVDKKIKGGKLKTHNFHDYIMI